ncbi:MAG TPA: acetyl-CoA carboxylase, carboxyltransferase subunit beta [Pseudonocardiaceae bacterium]
MTNTLAPVTGTEWTQCGACDRLVYYRQWDRSAGVCPHCAHHRRLTGRQRIEHLADTGSTEWLDFPISPRDPLGFVDSLPYHQRHARARDKTDLADAVACARVRVMGHPVVVAAMDFRFMGGSLGAGAGELITRAAEVALEDRTPLLIVTASGGARMQEGAISLMQMAKTTQALAALNEAGVLTLSLITDPTYGGVAASFATTTDIIIAEPKARMGFAGPRVIEQTINQQLPDGFQTAEFLLARGWIDDIVPRGALRPTLGSLLSTVVPADAGESVGSTEINDPTGLPDADQWESVRQARQLSRATTRDYLLRSFDMFLELRGDRVSGDCPAIVGGIGILDGTPVVAVGHQKGHTPVELNASNFGMPTPAGFRKAARLMRLAAKLGLPIVTFIDTPGAYPGIVAEEQGQATAIAENLVLMSSLPVPVVAVIIGEGGSGGALALGVADRVLMCAGAIYSVISAEGCAAILWNDASRAPEAARALKLDAKSLLTQGIVDAVIPERSSTGDGESAPSATDVALCVSNAITELAAQSPAERIRARRRRFRGFGTDVTTSTRR